MRVAGSGATAAMMVFREARFHGAELLHLMNFEAIVSRYGICRIFRRISAILDRRRLANTAGAMRDDVELAVKICRYSCEAAITPAPSVARGVGDAGADSRSSESFEEL